MFAVVAIGAGIAGCGDDTPAGAPPTSDGSAATAAATDLLDFRLPTVMGDEFDASGLAGSDVVVWFWSPWCTSCAQTADGIGRVAAELGDQVSFVGIAAAGTHDQYEDFLATHDLSAFPQLVDSDGEIWLRFGADTIRSSFFFLDDTGETARSGYGEIDEDSLRDRVEALIAS